MGTHRSAGSSLCGSESSGQVARQPGAPGGGSAVGPAARRAAPRGAARAAVRVAGTPATALRRPPRLRHAKPVAGATLAGGVVTVYGTNKADSIVLSQDTAAGTLTATVNGAATTFPAAGVTQVQVFPLNGNDYVSGGNLTVPLYIKGGARQPDPRRRRRAATPSSPARATT